MKQTLTLTMLALALGWAIGGSPAQADDAPAAVCVAPDDDGPDYYAIDLVPTSTIPGLKRADGVGRVSYAKTPFGISISPEGNYVYDLNIDIDKLRAAPEGHHYVAWVATSSLDQVQRIGPLDAEHEAQGQVQWNKYIVVITLERTDAPADASMWRGPIALRGLSRSGLMHTMAGHGPFQQEPCAQYGY
jgi:hypothetical protein